MADGEHAASSEFPALFEELHQRFVAGGMGRLSHKPVELSWAFLNHAFPLSAQSTLVDSSIKTAWVDCWVVCAGVFLPMRLAIFETEFETGADVGARAHEVNSANLPAMPDILGFGHGNLLWGDVPSPFKRPIANAFFRMPSASWTGRKSVAYYVMEHTAPINLRADDTESSPSVKTLDKISSRLMTTARQGAQLRIRANLSLRSLGLTRQRHKVLRNVVITDQGVPAALNDFAMTELLIEYEEWKQLAEKRQAEKHAKDRRDIARALGLRNHRDDESPTPPALPSRTRSKTQLGRQRVLLAQLDWYSDDDSDGAEDPEEEAARMARFRQYREESQSKLQPGLRSRTASLRLMSTANSPASGTPTPAAAVAPEDVVLDLASGGERQLSAVSIDADDAEDFVPTFSRPADCTMRARQICDECAEVVISAGYHFWIATCDSQMEHLCCAKCVNERVLRLVERGNTDIDTLTCPVPGCTGRWLFDDFAGILAPHVRRRWCRQSVVAARSAAEREIQGRIDKAAGAASGGGNDVAPAAPAAAVAAPPANRFELL